MKNDKLQHLITIIKTFIYNYTIKIAHIKSLQASRKKKTTTG